eukprot:scaffold274308_cov35-Tisochrysis_lutea.AAC.2
MSTGKVPFCTRPWRKRVRDVLENEAFKRLAVTRDFKPHWHRSRRASLRNRSDEAEQQCGGEPNPVSKRCRAVTRV